VPPAPPPTSKNHRRTRGASRRTPARRCAPSAPPPGRSPVAGSARGLPPGRLARRSPAKKPPARVTGAELKSGASSVLALEQLVSTSDIGTPRRASLFTPAPARHLRNRHGRARRTRAEPAPNAEPARTPVTARVAGSAPQAAKPMLNAPSSSTREIVRRIAVLHRSNARSNPRKDGSRLAGMRRRRDFPTRCMAGALPPATGRSRVGLCPDPARRAVLRCRQGPALPPICRPLWTGNGGANPCAVASHRLEGSP